ncbi:MAG: hypothetical protein ACLP0J_05755 [Solirubrobacteraceae bacterium]|jgi:hypothetical protein
MARADRRRSFASRSRPSGPRPLGHVGIRAIDCVRPDGLTIDTVALNPGHWRCSGLMADVLDGWVAHRRPGVDSRYARFKTTQTDKYALGDFARFVDANAGDPPALRLAGLSLELVSDWEADLAARFLVDGCGERKVSNEPHVRAAKLFAFIREAAAIGVVVDPILLDRARHGPRSRWHRHVAGQVLGFTDDEDRALKTALLAVLDRALAKVRQGAALIAAGKDPDQHGWNSLANLAWRAVLGGGLSSDDILERLWEPLGPDRKWANLDSSITDLWPAGKPAGSCGRTWFPVRLRARIWRLVFPSADDVLAAYFLFLALTGGEPSWAQSLSIDAIKVRGNGCVLTGFKGRRPFATLSERVFPRLASEGMCVPKLWELIVELTAPVRHVRCAEGAGDQRSLWLHMDAGYYRLGIVRWFCLREWWERNAQGSLSGYDSRSFRQGRRSVETIDVRGENLTGNPFEHSIDVFLNHYGDDPKLLVLTLETLDAFQQNWFDSVVGGKPEVIQRHGVVITTALMGRLIAGEEPARALVKASTGLDDDGLDRLICTEDNDTPVGAACVDITHPPFEDAVAGEVCQRLWVGTCFGCRNAIVTERHLPFIVHFYDSVIAEDQRDLPADLFAERWASVLAAIRTILDAFGADAVHAARREIASSGIRPFVRQIELGLGGRLW